MSSRNTMSLLGLLVAAVLGFVLVTPAQAAALTWNGTANMQWDTASTNWGGTTLWNNATPDSATFGATGVGTVSLTEGITVGALTFNTTGYVIDTSINTLALKSTGDFTITVASGVTAEMVSTNITNSAVSSDTIKTGLGTLVLSGTASTLTKQVRLASGTISISSIAALGSGSFKTYDGGTATNSTLLYTGSGETTGKSVLLDSNTANYIFTLDQSGTGLLKFTNFSVQNRKTGYTLVLQGSNTGNGEISSAIGDGAGGMKVTKAGTGTWTLSGANTYTGATTVSAGTLNITGTLANTAITVYGGGTLKVDAGAGGLLSSSSSLALGLNTYYTGGSTFIYDNTNAAGAKSQTLASLASQVTHPNDNTVQVTRTAAQPVNLIFTTVTSTASENGNTINFVTKDTAGSGVNGTDYKIVLADQTTYDIIKQNAYFNGGDFAVYDTTVGTGLLGFVRGIKYGTDAGSATSAGGASFAATTNQEITGNITAQPSVTLGATTSSLGTLKINGAYNITMSASNQAITLASTNNSGAHGILKTGGGKSTISGGSNVTFSAIQADIRVDGATDVLEIAMPLAWVGNSRFMKSGAGTLILSSGTTTFPAFDDFINGGVMEIGGSATIVCAFVTSKYFTIAPGALFRYNSSSTSTIGRGIRGGGAVTVAGSGTLTLSDANTYTGLTTVSAGTLTLGHATDTLDGAITVSGGTLNVDNPDTVGAVTLSSGTISGDSILTGTSYSLTDSGTISAVLTGSVPLTKSGAGTAILSAANTYTGATTVNQGTLAINGSGSINNSAVTINGGTLRYNSSVNYTNTLTFTAGTVGGTNLNGSLGGLTIGTGKTLSPGNSPGTAATTSQTWAGGGSIAWEINDAIGAAGSDPGWDLLTGTGTLTISANSGSKFNIDVTSLTLLNVAGDAANFIPLANYNWKIADFSTEITTFDATAFNVNTTGFSNDFTGGTFGVARGDSVSGGDNTQVYVTYVPEPATMALLGLGGLGVLLRRKRR